MVSYKNTILLLTGVVVALFLLVSQAGYYHVQSSVVRNFEEQKNNNADTGNEGEKRGAEKAFLFSNDAISTVVSSAVQHSYQFIQEIHLGPILDINAPKENLLLSTKYFLTLFRRIISPNAP